MVLELSVYNLISPLQHFYDPPFHMKWLKRLEKLGRGLEAL